MTRQLPPVDDDVFEALQQLAEPLVDDINSVLRRLLGSTGAATGTQPSPPVAARPTRGNKPRGDSGRVKRGTRAARGTTLPDGEYEEPILIALKELGGRGPASEVIARVGALLSERLTDLDRAPLASGEIRWRNRVQFARLNLVRAGDLRKDAPRGTWELADQGLQRLAQL